MDYKQKYLKYKEKYLQIKKLDGLIGGAAASSSSSASSSSTKTFDLFEAVKIATSTEPISKYFYLRDGTYYGNPYELRNLVRWYTNNNPSLESFEICKQAVIEADGDYKKAHENLISRKILDLERIKTLFINNLKKFFPNKELNDIVNNYHISFESKQYGSYWYKIVNPHFSEYSRANVSFIYLYGSKDNINWVKLDEMYVSE